MDWKEKTELKWKKLDWNEKNWIENPNPNYDFNFWYFNPQPKSWLINLLIRFSNTLISRSKALNSPMLQNPSKFKAQKFSLILIRTTLFTDQLWKRFSSRTFFSIISSSRQKPFKEYSKADICFYKFLYMKLFGIDLSRPHRQSRKILVEIFEYKWSLKLKH